MNLERPSKLPSWVTIRDTEDHRGAEATRRAAASLGQESDHAVIKAWSQELTCWFPLTQGRYRQVVEAARVGRDMAPDASVAVQLGTEDLVTELRRRYDREHAALDYLDRINSLAHNQHDA